MKNIVIVPVISLTLLVFSQVLVIGEVIELMNNRSDYRALGPAKLQSGLVVWGYAGEMYVYDGLSVKNITKLNKPIDIIEQHGKAQVAWGGNEIFYWDGKSITQLTNDTYWDQKYPKIHNGQIVWETEGWESYEDWESEIFYWDGLKIFQLTDNDDWDKCPKIHNGQVIWSVYRSSVYYWNGLKTTMLSDSKHDCGCPDIHNGRVVWAGDNGNGNEIFLWDGSIVQQLTHNNFDDNSPKIHKNLVVWSGRHDGNDYEIYFWNGSNIEQLTNNTINDINPQVHNNQVVWTRQTIKNEIYFWDGSDVIKLSNDQFDNRFPEIHNGKVVWKGYGDRDSVDRFDAIFYDDRSMEPEFEFDFDDDGICDDEEEKGPNGGDANSDGISDSLQSNVSSLNINDSQIYLIIESLNSTKITNCQVSSVPADIPEDVVFEYGFYEFSLSGITAGNSSTIIVSLPDHASSLDTYYKFGSTPDNNTPHWYEFMYDGRTGAKIDNVNKTITLYFIDGERGDDDLAANGTIIDIGGPGRTITSGDGTNGDNKVGVGGGGGDGCLISTMIK